MPIHNSMDALAAAALSYGNDEGPRLVKLTYSLYYRLLGEVHFVFWKSYLSSLWSGASS